MKMELGIFLAQFLQSHTDLLPAFLSLYLYRL